MSCYQIYPRLENKYFRFGGVQKANDQSEDSLCNINQSRPEKITWTPCLIYIRDRKKIRIGKLLLVQSDCRSSVEFC